MGLSGAALADAVAGVPRGGADVAGLVGPLETVAAETGDEAGASAEQPADKPRATSPTTVPLRIVPG